MGSLKPFLLDCEFALTISCHIPAEVSKVFGVKFIFLALKRKCVTKKCKINPYQPKVFGVRFSIREIERIISIE